MKEIIYLVRNKVDPAYIDEYSDWQVGEHVPWIITTPGYRSVVRFRSAEADNVFVNFWRLDGVEAYDSPYKQALSHSPWSLRLRRHREFHTDFYRELRSVGRDAEEKCLVNFMMQTSLLPGKADQLLERLSPLLSDSLAQFVLYENIRGKSGEWMLSCVFTGSALPSQEEIDSLRINAGSLLCEMNVQYTEILNSISPRLTRESFPDPKYMDNLANIIKKMEVVK